MSKYRVIQNANTGSLVLVKAKVCDTFWSHFKGLQLVRHLPEDEGLLFVCDGENRTQTAIHMFFMLFSIGVVWMDASGVVVDKQLAKPWRPYYAPAKPAQYFIEAKPSILERVQIGDTLQFDQSS